MTRVYSSEVNSQMMPSSPKLRLVVLFTLFAIGLGVRLYGIQFAPDQFHPLRQYRAALIARGMYLESEADSIPEWRLAVARANLGNMSVLEPRIMETLAVAAYGLAGAEYLWLANLLSAVFWMVGGIFLYLIGRKLMGEDPALLAAAFYLLVPYGVMASRSFQVDPLMIALMMASVYAMLWHNDQPSIRRLLVTAGVCSLAPIAKPISLFGLFLVFVALAFVRSGWREAINWKTAVFGLLIFLPSGLYYVPGMLGTGPLASEAQVQILPELLLERFFWAGWMAMIIRVIGPMALIGGVIGTMFLRREGAIAAVLVGLWGGYAVMCLVFTYTTYTHDYYHLQLIPIISLALGPLLTPVLSRLAGLYPREVFRVPLVAALALALAVFSANENRWRLASGIYYETIPPGEIQSAPEIGEAVAHSQQVILLSAAYGDAVRYRAEVAGPIWPTLAEYHQRQLQHFPLPAPADLFYEMVELGGAQYFVITDLGEYARQPELQAMLADYPVLSETPLYVIYDLRRAGSD